MAKTTKEMIEVMEWFDNGGEVEFITKGSIGTRWETVTLPSWDWSYLDYRIKKQKQKVTIEKWLCKSGENSFYIHEGTDAEGLEKVKLIESYEVEL